MIKKSGRWWSGTNFQDLRAYLHEHTAQGFPAGMIVQSRCECGADVFTVEVGTEQGCVRRACVACGRVVFIADSAECWSEARPAEVRCRCDRDWFEVGVAFSFRSIGDVRWITVGVRCVTCGVLSTCASWEIDYSPTQHLLTAV